MFSSFKRLIFHPYISLSLIFTFANLFANTLNYAFHFLVSHTYGPTIYGEIVSFFAHLYILGVPSTIFNTFVIKYIGRGHSHQDKQQRFAKIYSTFHFRSPLVLLFIFIIAFSLFFLGRYNNLSLTSSLTLSLVFSLSILTAYLSSFLYAFKAFLVLSFALVISASFKFFGGLIAYLTSFPHLSLLWLFLILGTLTQTYLLYRHFQALVNNLPSTTALSPSRIFSQLFSSSYILMTLAVFSVTALANFDVIFARKFLSPQSAGLYGAWSMLSKIVVFASGPLNMVTFVFFSDKRHTYSKSRLLFLSSLLNLVFGLGLFLIYTFFGRLVILSLFGSAFLQLLPHLISALFFGLLYSFITNLNNYFIAHDSPLSLLTSLFFIVQIIIFFLYGHSFSQLIHLQLLLTSLLMIFQSIFLAFIHHS